MPSDREFINTHVMRSRLMLEVASDLVARPDWSYRQVQIHLREQGGESWKLCLFASDAPASVDAVVRGEADIAIVNPGGVLAMAAHGAGSFKAPIPGLRAIMVFPQFDQLGFGVTARTGLRSLTTRSGSPCVANGIILSTSSRTWSFPLRLDMMCRDAREGPLTVPLHPAAERFWREQGYLP